jgi:hypothetical protein
MQTHHAEGTESGQPAKIQEAAMGTNEVGKNDATSARVDTKLEIVVIPVSDVDRAKEFYARLGWRLDADYDNGSDFRVVQFTPPWLGVLGDLRQERHRGSTRLCAGAVPDRLRPRGRS